MAKRKIVWERMNETFKIVVYDDGIADFIDCEDNETISSRRIHV